MSYFEILSKHFTDAILHTMTDELLLERIDQIVASQLEPVKATQLEHSKDLKSLKSKVKSIDKTLNMTIKFFDERIVENAREISHIKSHLDLTAKH